MTQRNIKDAPFLWAAKPAVRRIREGCEDGIGAPYALAVYLALCEIASNAQAETFDAGKAEIMHRSGVSKAQVKRVLPRLRELGVIDWRQNLIPGSVTQLPSTYTLLTSVPAEPTLGSTGTHPGLWHDEGAKEPVQKNRKNQKNPEESSINSLRQGEAESIYGVYPRKVGKQSALKQIATALKTVSAETLLERTTAYAAAVARWPAEERRFVPHPERWFKKGCWEDDPITWEPSSDGAPKKGDRHIPPPRNDYYEIGGELEPKGWWQGWLAEQYRGFDEKTTWDNLPTDLRREVLHFKNKGGDYGKPGRFPTDPDAPEEEGNGWGGPIDPEGWREWMESLGGYTAYEYAGRHLKEDFTAFRKQKQRECKL